MSHYQVKISEIGQLCLRAPAHPDALACLFRINDYGLITGGPTIGQYALLPAELDPYLNTDAEYQVGGQYFHAQLPRPLTGTWAPVPAFPIHEPTVDLWGWVDSIDPEQWKYEQEINEYELRDKEPEPVPDSSEFAAWLNESYTAICKVHGWYTLDILAGELGTTPGYLARVINNEEVADEFFQDNARALVAMYIAPDSP